MLRELRPDAVLGAGGYVAGPVGLGAVLRRVPLVLMEADSHLGLTNRLLAPRARRVCLAFPTEGREPPRYRVTGRPVPPPAADRAAARRRFGIDPAETCVLVFGGSLGARSINHAAIEAFAGARFHVLHAAGERDLASLQSPGPHYDLRGYINDFGEALAACDLVVARSGGSVFEIAAHAKPAVLIPYPHATADHQSANARYFEQAGAAVVIPDGELDGSRLAAAVGGLLADRPRLAAMSRAAAEPRPSGRRRGDRRRGARGGGRAGASGEPAVGRPRPALRRHRRRRDERTGARGGRARRRGDRQRPRGLELLRAPARARHRAAHRPRRRRTSPPERRSSTRRRSGPRTPSGGPPPAASSTAPSCWRRSRP